MRRVVQIFLDQSGNHTKMSQLDTDESIQYTSTSRRLVDFCQYFENIKHRSWSPHNGVWEAWTSCYANSKASSQWKQVIHKVGQFCLAAGSPEASNDDPFQSLQNLRDTLSRHFLYTADLHKRIFDLQTQINQQQRTITALAYRGILENIVTEENGRGPVEKWKNFLKYRIFFDNDKGNSKKLAEKQGDLKNRNKELDGFLKKYQQGTYGQQHIREVTDLLYSTLSREIHNFRPTSKDDQYAVSSGQFDHMTMDFLLALKPLADNVAGDGSVDWEKEQERYPLFPDLTSIQHAKAELSSSVRATESAMDDINVIFE